MTSAAVKTGSLPTSSRRASRGPSRGGWFGAALALFLAFSFVALRQEPRPDPGRAIGPLHGEWWLSPLEPSAERRLLQVDADLNQVFALRGTSHVWLVGNGGLILHSADAGRTWERQRLIPEDAAVPAPEPTPAPAPNREPAELSWRNLLPSDPLEAVLLVAMAQEAPPTDPSQLQPPQETLEPPPAANKGEIDPSQMPQLQYPVQSPIPNPQAQGPPPGAVDAIADPPGPALRPDRNQVRPQRQEKRPAVAPTPSPKPEPNSTPVAAVAPDAAALAHADLLSVHFVDEKNGWVAGLRGALFSTADGGETWTYHDAGIGAADHFLVWSEDDGRISVYSDDGVRSSRDHGRTWAPLKLDRFTHTNCPSFDLSPVPPGYPDFSRDQAQIMRSIDCLDRIEWNVAGEGGVWRSDRVGKLGQRIESGTTAGLRSVSFADGNRGFIAGGSGTLLASSDGGATWFPLSRPPDGTAAGSHWVFPAPWYFASLLLVGLVLAPAFRRPVVVAPERSVADLLVSDRPIDAGDPDPLDFGAVALGLSRFLRNEKTQPPLTLAVTGEWGSGKSSLMNLLRADLRRYGFRPVWFNAWHHQKEEHLLASLLEAVRAQAVPSKWRPEGMLFRLKLLGIRGVRVWPLIALLLLAFAVSLGYLRSDPGRLAAANAWLAALPAKAADPIGAFAEWTAGRATPPPAPGTPMAPGAPEAPAGRAPLAALLLSSAGLLAAAWRGAKAFGVNPASLLNREAGAPRVKDLKDLTSFRHKFAAEFQDVTRALHPRTLLVLIDDLDRCRPENVLEVLEAVNFLVSSGECYVVMGMARERVVRCVGLSFKDVADELLDAPDGGSETDARRRRFEFAQQYLEKLINIEVPVPVPTGDQARRLLDPIVDAEEPEPGRRRLPAALRAAARRALPVAGLLLLLAAGYRLGSRWTPEPAVPLPEGSASSLPGAAAGPAPITSASPEIPATATRPARFEPGDTVRRSDWLLALLALTLLGLGLWRLSVPPDLIVRDSEEFERALAAWHPLVYARRGTPRSVKRFLNRVRYLAMLQRRQGPEPTFWTRLRDRLRRRTQEPSPTDPESRIPERALVALAALEHHRPEWLQDNELFMDFPGFLRRADLPPEIQKLANDPDWQLPLFHYWPAYLEMSRGLQVG